MPQISTLAFTGTTGKLRVITAVDPAAAPATYYLTRERCLIYLVSPDRATYWRIGQWSALTVEKEEHDAGVLSITVPINAAWIASATAESAFDTVTGWEEFSFDVYIDGTLEWSGPIVERRHTPGAATHAYPAATFTAETFTQHLAKRRANNSVGKANATYTDQADDIIRQALRNCNGTITPTGYPVGVSRSDFGSWTVSVQADTGSASSISIEEQDGNNVWLFVSHVAQKGDCYVYAQEGTPAAWTYRVAYPYQENDRTASIVLTPPGGSVSGFTETRSLMDIVNVSAVKGDGATTTQVKGWQSDSASITVRGVYEGERTLAGASSTTYTDTEASAILTQQAEPSDLLEVNIRSTSGARFTFHASSTTGQYGMRDKVSIVLPLVSTAATAIVRGWKIEQTGEGPFRESIKVGDMRTSVGKAAALATGWPGPFSSGDRLHTNSGS